MALALEGFTALSQASIIELEDYAKYMVAFRKKTRFMFALIPWIYHGAWFVFVCPL